LKITFNLGFPEAKKWEFRVEKSKLRKINILIRIRLLRIIQHKKELMMVVVGRRIRALRKGRRDWVAMVLMGKFGGKIK
jgi:hypothetical protein